MIEDMNSPKFASLISLYHGNELIVSNKETGIFPGDRIILFSSEKIYKDLTKIFTEAVE